MYYYKRTFFALVFSLLLILIIALVVSNAFTNKVKKEEKEKITLWVHAVQKRSQLIEDTKIIFDQINELEQYKAQQLADAYQHIIEMPDNTDLRLYERIIRDNETIPYLLVDEEGNITNSRNISEDYLAQIVGRDKQDLNLDTSEFKKITIRYLPEHYIYLYYKESNISTKLNELLIENFENFTNDVIQNQPSGPVIVTNSERTHVYAFGNIDSNIVRSPKALAQALDDMGRQQKPFPIKYGPHKAYVYYEDSVILRTARFFSIFSYGATSIIFVCMIIMLMYNRQTEKDRLWAGLTKETAHQMGTPLSALIAWTEILKKEDVRPEIISEIEKDVQRLDIVSRRFSNIGSIPETKRENIQDTVQEFAEYFGNRISKKINIEIQSYPEPLYANINKNLFTWVLENLGRNSVDAMEGEGKIRITYGTDKKHIWIDFCDTGKGMSRKNTKKIFLPGFTTKKRGWGVGLTFCQRIIQSYHHGKIVVHHTEPGKGTTFRIFLPTRQTACKKS